jgi:hypothetical protein
MALVAETEKTKKLTTEQCFTLFISNNSRVLIG